MSVNRRFDPDARWPEGGLQSIELCPVCGSSARRLMYADLADSVFFAAPGGWNLYECGTCHSGYLDPRPTPETLPLAYRNYYTHDATPDWDAHHALPRRFVHALANGYRNRRFRANLTPSLRIGRLFRHIPSLRDRLDRNLRHLPPVPPNSRLLDIGCGDGAFLAKARAIGWDVLGVEPDPIAARRAQDRGLSVIIGSYEEVSGLEGQLDVVTLSHVIEHVHDPLALLRKAHALLAPGGQLWIETPNLASWTHQRFQAAWRGLEPPRHLVLFTWQSLRRALSQSGFVHVEFRPAPFSSTVRASTAIEDGLDPRAVKHTGSRHLPLEFLRWIRSRLSYDLCENVTIIAHKAGGP